MKKFALASLLFIFAVQHDLVLAFPTNAVLENFTGADGTSPPNANWTLMQIFGSTGNTRIYTNAATSNTGGSVGGSYWNPTTFNIAQEAFGTEVVVGASTWSCVGTRLQDIGAGTTDGYLVCGFQATVELYRIDNGSSTLLGAAFSQATTNGDKIGLTSIGSQHCVYFNDNGGGWTQLGCRTEGTYLTSGRIGIVTLGSTTTTVMDDFGGGNLPTGGHGMPLFLSWLMNPISAIWDLVGTNAYAGTN